MAAVAKKEASLEEQVVRTNPVLEAFGMLFFLINFDNTIVIVF